MTQIFGAHAQQYWDAGLAVIPLHALDKRPVPTDWSRFHDMLPTPDEQANWLRHYVDCNMGLVLGRQSGICCIDIDTPDDRIIEIILKVLPKSPWVRVGKKGMVMAYRWTGHRPFRIKDAQGGMIVELLSTKQQVVLPPSIHPDTRRPYTANCELLEVCNALPDLDAQIEEILRGALSMQGVQLAIGGWTKVTEWTPSGARDVQMTAVAGHYANGVLRGELPVIDAIERMKSWYATCTEKIAGDDVNIEKGIQNLVKFIIRDVVERGKPLPKGWDASLTEEVKASMGLVFTADQEEWDYERIKTYLHSQFGETDPESAARLETINYALQKISQSNNLTALHKEQLLTFIRDAGGMKVSMTALKSRIKELGSDGIEGLDHAEIARAVIAELEKVAPVRFWGNNFWSWVGAHWEKMDQSAIMGKIITEFGHLPAAKRASDHYGIMQTMKNIVPNQLKTHDIEGVNFANGVLLSNGHLIAHDPGFGFTYVLPFRYLPDEWGKAPKFQEFLTRVWGRHPDFEAKVAALQEAICVTIFGMGPRFQKAILLFGAPKSGKSQLLDIVRAIMPDQAISNVPPHMWSDKFAPAEMVSSLLNACGELSEKHQIDGQSFKSIVDGTEMQAQRKHQALFNFKPRCTHWFASNHLPRTEDTSNGFTRRWLILTFDSPIETSEVILDYGQKIAAEEREAIVSWAVRAMPRLLEKQTISEPNSHVGALKEVATLNNSVRFFMLESPEVILSPGLKDPRMWADGGKTLPRISETTLHHAYYRFCLGEGGAKPVGPRIFRTRMSELAAEMGFRRNIRSTGDGVGVCEYVGLTLKAAARAA